MTVTVTLSLNGTPVPVTLDDAALAAIAAALPDAGTEIPESKFLTIAETAELLRCKRQRVDDLLSSGRLTRHKEGGRTLVSRAELEAHVAAGGRR